MMITEGMLREEIGELWDRKLRLRLRICAAAAHSARYSSAMNQAKDIVELAMLLYSLEEREDSIREKLRGLKEGE